MFGKPIDVDRLKKFEEELAVALDKVENIFLADTPFLCGHDITIGDLLGICELMQPYAVHYDIFNDRPKLKRWSDRVKQTLQPHFDESHSVLMRVRDLFQPKL